MRNLKVDALVIGGLISVFAYSCSVAARPAPQKELAAPPCAFAPFADPHAKVWKSPRA